MSEPLPQEAIPPHDADDGGAIPPPPPPPVASSVQAVPSASKTAQDRLASHQGEGRKAEGPRGYPIVGNTPQIAREGLVQFMERSWREYGDVYRANLLSDTVVVAHPDGVQRVLAGNADNYIKGKAYDGVREVIGDGILALQGPKWRKRRTLMMPKFHRGSLEGLVQIMIDRGAVFFDDLKRRHPDGGRIDAHDEMVGLTLDVVVNALFGSGLGEAAEVDHESLGMALEVVSEVSNGVPVPKWIPTATNRKFKRVMRDVESTVYRVIETARALPENEREDTLLQMLLDARDAETGEPLTDEEVRNEVFTLFIAGHETTALTLTWLFTLIDGRDDVKDKLREEVDRVLGKRTPTFDDLTKLTYTRQVIDETLRLRGPVAMVARHAVEDDNICGVKINKGDLVLPFFWGLHRHPDHWPNPEHFDPSRFTPEAIEARDKWAYVPFSAGSRVCIGNTFSLYEATLLLAMMVQRFDVDVVPGQDLSPVMLATVRPKGEVQVDLKWRT